MEYPTIYTHPVDFHDVDPNYTIRFPNLLNHIIRASETSEEQLGVSIAFLKERYNAIWVISRMTIQMQMLPMFHDELCIETWDSGMSHGMVTREYRLYIRRGMQITEVGTATSIWTILNRETHQIENDVFDADLWKHHFLPDKINIQKTPLPKQIVAPTAVLDHCVHYTDLDIHNHCNSASYIQFMMNACEHMTGKTPVVLDIRYSREVFKNEWIKILVDESPDKILYLLQNEQKETVCSASLTLKTTTPLP
jgi:acyl-ACP thioesterase